MELDSSYDLNFLYVEETVAQAYREGIKKIRHSSNSEKVIGYLVGIANALEQSTPAKGSAVSWAREIIPAYRNLTRILSKSVQSLKSKKSDLIEKLNELTEFRNTIANHNIKNLEELEKVLEESSKKDKEIESLEYL